MTTVNRLIDQVNLHMLDAIARTAVHHPHMARLLSVGAAICDIVEGILFAPACCIEHIIRAGINFGKCVKADSLDRQHYYNLCVGYLKKFGCDLAVTPLYP